MDNLLNLYLRLIARLDNLFLFTHEDTVEIEIVSFQNVSIKLMNLGTHKVGTIFSWYALDKQNKARLHRSEKRTGTRDKNARKPLTFFVYGT
jgi:hypothetical protein